MNRFSVCFLVLVFSCGIALLVLAEDNDPCDSSPCLNGGFCSVDNGSYSCICVSSYSGFNCGKDPCSSGPCLNGGTCSVTGRSYLCDCVKNYFGSDCEDYLDPCFPKPCKNEGICIPDESSFKCNCTLSFTGNTCEEETSAVTTYTTTDVTTQNPCDSNPCQNGGTCRIRESAICDCFARFTGNYCEENLDPCVPDPCRNEGMCIPDGGGFKCNCSSTFTGQTCEEFVETTSDLYDLSISNESTSTVISTTDPCVQNHCENNGKCVGVDGNIVCVCEPLYAGALCETYVLDLCYDEPCGMHGVCTMEGDDFKCNCTLPYTGRTCDKILDPCIPNPCLNGGECDVVEENWTCRCKVPFSGDHCEKEFTSTRTTTELTTLNPMSSSTSTTATTDSPTPSSEGTTATTNSPIASTEGTTATTSSPTPSPVETTAPTSSPQHYTEETTAHASSTITSTEETTTSSSSSTSATEDTTVFDLCLSSPCLNNGTCFNYNNSIQCNCSHSYSGDLCEKEIVFETPSSKSVIYACSGAGAAVFIVIGISAAVLWHLRRVKRRERAAWFQNADDTSLESENSRTYLA